MSNLLPQPIGSDWKDWARKLLSVLQLSGLGGGISLPIYDKNGRVIVDDGGLYVYDQNGDVPISPDIVQIDTANLVDAAITTDKIANLSVNTAKLAALAVDAAKLANSAVEAQHIANAAVGSAAIANAAVGTAHIANAAITSALIGDLEVITAKIADLAVNSAKIANAAIGTEHVQNAAIGNAQIDRVSANKLQVLDADIVNLSALKIIAASLSSISANLGTITAGNITLDGEGYIRGGQSAYNTGNGFWMGYNNGNYRFSMGNASLNNGITWDGLTLRVGGELQAATGTFSGALQAATGTFAGSLQAATGTFSGYLQAATGTFSGTLTANAVNAVDTINLRGNAVTVPVSAFGAGALGDGGSYGWLSLISAGISTSGGVVYISTGFSFISGPSYATNTQARILRNGYAIASDLRFSGVANAGGIFSFSMGDSPGPGYFVYELQIYVVAITGPFSASNRSMFLLEAKR